MTFALQIFFSFFFYKDDKANSSLGTIHSESPVVMLPEILVKGQE